MHKFWGCEFREQEIPHVSHVLGLMRLLFLRSESAEKPNRFGFSTDRRRKQSYVISLILNGSLTQYPNQPWVRNVANQIFFLWFKDFDSSVSDLEVNKKNILIRSLCTGNEIFSFVTSMCLNYNRILRTCFIGGPLLKHNENDFIIFLKRINCKIFLHVREKGSDMILLIVINYFFIAF